MGFDGDDDWALSDDGWNLILAGGDHARSNAFRLPRSRRAATAISGGVRTGCHGGPDERRIVFGRPGVARERILVSARTGPGSARTDGLHLSADERFRVHGDNAAGGTHCGW